MTTLNDFKVTRRKHYSGDMCFNYSPYVMSSRKAYYRDELDLLMVDYSGAEMNIPARGQVDTF